MIGALDLREERFTREAPGWMRPEHETCPALGETGCRLEFEQRPLACQLYPFQFATMVDKTYMIFLDVRICPSWKVFGEDYEGAVEMFKAYMKEVRDASAAALLRDEKGSDAGKADH
jgi:Fe-S-cluster containining protein